MFRTANIYWLIITASLAPLVASAQDVAADTAAFFMEERQAPAAQMLRIDGIRTSQVIAFRNALDAALHVGETSQLETIIARSSPDFIREHIEFVQLGRIFMSSVEEGELHRDTLIEKLGAFDAGENWYADVYAKTALSALHIRSMELLVSAQYAQSALERIPEETSALVSDAQLLLAEQLTMLYSVSADPNRMLVTSRTSRELHDELGLDFNRYELMTNFLLAFNWRRDHAGAEVVAEMLTDEPQPEGVIEGLAEVYIADHLNEIGDYAAALQLAERAQSTSDPLVQRRSTGEAMIAYAGLGNRNASLTLMREMGLWDENGPTIRSDRSEGGLHARALLAASEGNAAQAVALMNQRLDLMIGKMYERSAADTSSFLSHLENNRERQVEREAALQREAELRAVQLEQKNRLNRLLWVLIGLLTVAFNMLLAFLRYREKNNRKVRALQEDALSAEKMKTEFLGVVNHELRTPLNGIIGISDAMIHHAESPALREQAQTVQESGQLLHDLLDSLITMSTIEGDRLVLDEEPTDLAVTISREITEWSDAAEEKGLAFTHFIADGLSDAVRADAKRLRQCLRYLLSNAIRFTHSGRVHVHATVGPDTEAGRLALNLVVADTGQGISEVVQSRLFKPFLQADATMTRKYGGAGLSLAIARKLARMMGGDLTVTSREGRGSEFLLTASLPLVESELQETVQENEVAPETKAEAGVGPRHASPIPDVDLDGADTPEALIDLMLRDQLPSLDPERATEEPQPLRSAG